MKTHLKDDGVSLRDDGLANSWRAGLVGTFDFGGTQVATADVIAALARDGVVIIRNVLPDDRITEIIHKAELILGQPSIAGSVGYSKVDHPKRMANPMQIGRPLVELVTDTRILDIIEGYMASEAVLAEAILKRDEPVGYTYFELHSDFAPGWSKTSDSSSTLTEADMSLPVGVGGVLYLHDTASGAFSYCLGTHILGSPRGQNLSDYPDSERASILSNLVRVDGKRGDLVLFDDRGFHGPDQPSASQRTVVLLDYYRVETLGFKQVTPLQIYTSDLGGLDERQFRALGIGAEPMVAAERSRMTRFRENRVYGLCRFLVDHSYRDRHIIQKIKHRLRNFRG